ncbi:MAG TPA: YetF domain-containing protein, partial [Solirubrobacterales bacterium]|nr:YetF domain-containing protein [Solirubrobacterales bacterium]
MVHVPVANIFDLDVGIDEKIVRSLLVFVFLAFALRLGGKREMGQLNVLDLAVLLLASNALQNALIGNDDSVTGGLIGAGTLFVANYVFVRLTFFNSRARRILEGEPRVLLRNGKPIDSALRKEAISRAELVNAALEKGFGDLADVGLIVLETNGQMVCLNQKQA